MKNYLEVNKDFYNNNVDRYITLTGNLQQTSWLKSFIKLIKKGGKVLDLGCGYGRDLEYFYKMGYAIFGLDISEKMIERAKKEAPKAKLKIGNLLKLDYNDDYFDGIWCSATLIHIAKKDACKALSEMNRVLKKEGVLHLTFREGTGEKYKKDKKYNNKEKYYSYYNKDEIFTLLNKHHFDIIKFSIVKKRYRKTRSVYLLARKEN